MTELPPWVSLDHAGLVARYGRTRQERFTWLGLVVIATVWTAVVCGGLYDSGASSHQVGPFALGIPFFWMLVAGLAPHLLEARELRLTADGLSYDRRLFGWRRHTYLALRHLSVDRSHTFDNKGGTTVGLHVSETRPGERRKYLWVALPGGLYEHEREQVMAGMEFMASTLERAIEQARSAPGEDDAAQREALGALLHSLHRERGRATE